MSLARTLSALLLASGLHAAALADAIPPPAELNETQKALIGIWQEDNCVMPEGLGHACLNRVLAFGNENASQLYFSSMSMSNEWGTSAQSGTWTATADGENTKISIKHADGTIDELVIKIESLTAFTLVSASDAARFPASHFTRPGSPVPQK